MCLIDMGIPRLMIVVGNVTMIDASAFIISMIVLIYMVKSTTDTIPFLSIKARSVLRSIGVDNLTDLTVLLAAVGL